MKRIRIIFIIASLTVVSAAHSQIRIGAKGGVSIANASFSKDVFDAKNLTGFNIGPVIELMFGNIGFDGAVLYTQKGFQSEEETVKNSCLQVPVNLKYKFGNSGIKPYLAAGPYIDLKIAGNSVWDVFKSKEGIKQQLESQSFGAGLNFAAGIELISKLQVGVNFNWGLTDDYKSFNAKETDSYKGKSTAWSVNAVLFF